MENIPSELQLNDITKVSSVIQESFVNSIINTNGSSFSVGSSPGQYVNFQIPAADRISVDLNSLFFTCYFKVNDYTSAGNGYVGFCDSIESICDIVEVQAGNGELCEQIRNYYLCESAITPYIENENYKNGFSAGTNYRGSFLNKHAAIRGNTTVIGAGAFTPNTISVGFSLKLSGLCNSQKLWHSFLSSQPLTIRIYLKESQNVVKAFTSAQAIGAAAGANFGAETTISGYVISNCKLHYKAVRVSNAYMSQLLAYSSTSPISYPIRTFYNEQKSLTLPNGISSWSDSIVANFKSIENVYMAFFQNLGQQATCNEDRLRYPFMTSFRLIVNGQSIPQGQPIDLTNGGAEGQVMLQRCFNLRTVEQLGNQSLSVLRNMAVGGTARILADHPLSLCYAKERSTNNVFGWSADDNQNLVKAGLEPVSSFLIGIPLSKSDYTDETTLTGLDTTMNSGIISWDAQFNNTSGGPLTFTVLIMVEHTRVLQVSPDSTRVIY